MRQRGGLLPLLLLAMFCCLPAQAQFGDWYQWLHTNSGLWSDSTHWSRGQPPPPSFPAYLGSVQAGAIRTITFDPTAGSSIGQLYIQQTANATNRLVLTAFMGVNTFATLEASRGLLQVWVQSNTFAVGSFGGTLMLSNAVGAGTLLTIDAPAGLEASNVFMNRGTITNAGLANVSYGIVMTNSAQWAQLGGQLTALSLTNTSGSIFSMSGGLVSFTNRVDNAATFTQLGGTNTTVVFLNEAGALMFQTGGVQNIGYVTNQGTWSIGGTSVARLTNFVGEGSTLNVSGGQLIVSNLLNASGGPGTINVSGTGMIMATGGVVAATGTGVLNMDGGNFVWVTTPTLASNATANGTINLNGGVLTVPGLNNGSGTGNLFFNGGVLQFSSSTNVTGLNTFAVMTGGALVDSSNYVVTFLQPLTNGLGGGLDGGLTKLGNGTLILTNGNTYNGPTRILGGSLLGTNFSGSLIIGPGGSIGPAGVLDQAYLSWLDAQLSGMLTGAVVMNMDTPNNLVFTNHLANAFLGSAAATGAVYSGVVTWTNNPSTVRFGGGSGLMIYPFAISPVNGQSNLIIGPTSGNALSIVQLNSPASIYSGGTIVNAGTLRLGGSSVLGSPTGAVYVTVNPGGALDLNGYNISGLSQTVMISGMGIGPQAGAIYNGGPNLVNLGVRNVTLTSDAAVGQYGGGRFDILGVLNGNGNNLFKVGSNQTFMSGAGYITNVPTIVINGGLFGIQGAGQLAGAGATVIQAYTGGTFGVYGNLSFTNALQLYGGTFQNSGPAWSTVSWNGPVAVNGTTNFFDTGPGRAMVINGDISGAGAVAKVNANMLVLSGSNSYTGGTMVSNGVLQFSSLNAVPVANTISVGTNGVIQFNFANSQAGVNRLDPTNAVGVIALTSANINDNLDLATPNLSNVWLGAVGAVAYNGAITPFGDRYLLGGGGSNGTLILTGNNLQSAGTVLIGGGPQPGMVLMNGANSLGGVAPSTVVRSNGLLSIASEAAIGGVGAGLTFSGGTVQIRGVSLTSFNNLSVNWTNSATAIGFDGSLDINNNGNTFTVANSISGYGITNKMGLGTLVLSGNNFPSTSMVIRAGAVRIQNGGALGDGSLPANVVLVNSGGVLQVAGGITTLAVPITLNGSGIGSGSLNNNDGALRSISGINTLNNPIILGSPSRINADAGSTLVLAGLLTNVNRATTFGGSGNIRVTGNIAGGGALTKDGYGTMTVSGQSTGALAVVSGRVVLDYPATPATGGLMASNATLALGGFGMGTTTGGMLVVNGPLAFGNAVTQSFSGVTLYTGNNTIMASNYGGSLIVNLGPMVRSSILNPNNNYFLSNGIVNFLIPAGLDGGITTTTSNNNAGVLGGWAIINGKDWASVTDVFGSVAQKITNFTGYVSLNNGGLITNTASVGSNQNLRLTSTGLTNYYGMNYALSRTVTVNSIIADGPGMSVITNRGQTLRLGQSGGILAPTNSGGLTIGASVNDGFLTAGGANNQSGELIFINNSTKPININASITTNYNNPALSVSFNGTGVVNIYGNDVRGPLNVSGSDHATFVNGATVNYFGSNVQSGQVMVRAGELNFMPGSTNNFGWNSVVDGGVMNIHGAANFNYFNQTANALIIGNAANSRGVVTVDGSVSVGNVMMGNALGAAGALYQTDGVIRDTAADGDNNFGLGRANGGYGYYRITGGNLLVNGRVGIGYSVGTTPAYGVFDMYGGLVNVGMYLFPARSEGGAGVLNIFGGQMNAGLGTDVAINWDRIGYGMINVGDSGVANFAMANSRYLNLNRTAGGTGVVNLLSGGTLVVNAFSNVNSGLTLMNFDGGLLQVNTNGIGALGANFMQGLSAATIYQNGAFIDTFTNAITIGQNLQAPTGYGLSSIAIANGGAGYIGAPNVVISGGSGTGATAVAHVDLTPGSPTYQQVTDIRITSPGFGYLSNDWLTVQLVGGGAVQAAQLGAFSFGANTGGGLTKLGGGLLALAGSNTYTGATVIRAGTLSVSNDWNIAGPTSALVFSGGLLQVTGTTMSNIDSHAVNWNAFNGGFDIANVSNVFTTTNIISGSGSFTKIGSGTLVLNNANTYTGNTLIGGPVQIATLGAFGGSGRSVYYTNAIFIATNTVSNAALLDRLALTLNNFTLALTTNSAENLDFSPFVNAYLSANTGQVINYTGVLNGGSSRIGLGGAGGTLVFNNQQIGGTPNYVSIGYTNVTIGMPGTVGNTVVTTNNHDNLGITTVNAGNTLQLGDGGNSGMVGPGPVVNNGTMIFNRTNTVHFTNYITGVGGIVQAGSGTMVLDRNYYNSNGFTVANGALILSNAVLNGQLALTNGVTVTAVGGSGLVGEFYQLPAGSTFSNINSIANAQNHFATLNVTAAGNINPLNPNFDYGTPNPNWSFPSPFSTVNSANFEGRWVGTFTAPTTGNYTFQLFGDDAQVLWIDGTLVASNTAASVWSQGSIQLAAGSHSIQFNFSQGTGGYGIMANVLMPGSNAFIRLPNSLLSSGPAVYSLSGDAASTLVLSNTLPSPMHLMVVQTNDAVFAGRITENGVSGLYKLGTSMLTLAGSNSFSAGVVLGAGRLSVSNNVNLGGASAPIAFNGGLLQVTGTTLTNLNSHVVNWSNFNGGFDIADPGNVFSVTNAIGDGGNFYKYGAGTLVMAGSNSYTGATVINGGILRQANAFAFGPNNLLSINGGTLDLNGYGLIATSLVFTTGFITDNSAPGPVNTVVLTNLPASTFGGVITDGAGGQRLGLTVYGGGALTLTNSSTYSGATLLNTGVTMVLSGALGGLVGSTNIVLNGAMLTLNNTAAANNPYRLGYATPIWMNGATYNFTNDANTLLVTQTNGPLTLVGGTNNIITRQSTNVGVGVLVFNSIARETGAVLNFVSANIGVNSQNIVRFTTAPAIPGGGTILPWATINGTNWATYETIRGSISNFYSYMKGPDAGWSIGDDVLTNNSLTLSSSRTINSFNMALVNNSVFDFSNSTLSLVSGGLLISGTNWGVTMSNGFLTAGDGLGSAAELNIILSPTVLTNGAVLLTNSVVITDNPVGLDGNPTVVTLVKSGTGTMLVGNTNTYSGGTIINAGTIYITNDSPDGVSGSLGVNTNDVLLTLNGGTLQTTNNFALYNRPTFLGVMGGTLNVDNNSTLLHTNLISGTGTLFKGGTGTLVLNNATTGNTYSGGTVITNGTIYLFGDNNNLGADGTPVILGYGGALRVTNSFTFANRPFVMGPSGGFINVDAASSVTITNTVSGVGSLSMMGSGSLTLSGNNTYTGGTIVSNGMLVISGNNVLGGGALYLSGALSSLASTNNVVTNFVTGGMLSVTGGFWTVTNAWAIMMTNTFVGPSTNWTTNINAVANVVSVAPNSGLTLAGPTASASSSLSRGSLTEVGGGTLVIANNTRYSDGTYVGDSSTLILSNNATLNSPLVISNGATVISKGSTGLLGEYFVAAGNSNNMVSLTQLQNVFAATNANNLYFNQQSTNFENPATAIVQPNAGVSFAVARYQGQFNAPTSGMYQFNLPTADDYGAVFVDGARVTSGGGGSAGLPIYLTAGAHNIQIYNANNAGGYGIIADVVMPGVGVAQRLGNWLLSGSGPAIAGLSGGATAQLFLSNGVLSISQTNDASFDGVITGAGGINKLGTNTLALAGAANDFLGGAILSEGRLSIGSLASLGSSTSMLTFAGGILQITGTAVTDLGSHPINTSLGATFNGGFDIVDPANYFTVTNVLTGPGATSLGQNNSSGGLAKYGSGTLVLGGGNTFFGGVTINAGTIQVGNVTALGFTNPVTFNGGSVDLNGNNIVVGGLIGPSGVITDNLGAGGASTLTVSNVSGNTVFGGTIADGAARSLAVVYGIPAGSPGGILSLTNNNSYTGNTIINGGRLFLSNALGALSGTPSITINPLAGLTLSNTVAANNTNRLRADVTLVMNGGDFTVGNDGGSGIYTQSIGTVSVNAGGSIIYTMTNSPTGTNILTINNVTRTAGATIGVSGSGLGVNSQNIVRLTAPPVLVNGIIAPWAYANSAGRWEFATYNAALDSISNYVYTNALSGNVSETVQFNANFNAKYVGNNQTLTMTGSRTNYTLTVEANGNTANINMNAYGMTLLGNGLLDSTTGGWNSVIYNGTLTAGTNTAPSELVASRFGTGGGLYLRSRIVDNGPLSPLTFTKNGLGNVMLEYASNTFSGGAIIANGLLYVGSDSGYTENPFALGTGAVTVQPGTQLRFGGSGGGVVPGVNYNIGNAVNLSGGYIVAIAGNQHLTGNINVNGLTNSSLYANYAFNDLYLDGAVSGSGGLRVVTGGNGGAVFLTNTNNTYSGGTLLDGGYLFLGSNSSLGTGPLTVNNPNSGIGPTNALSQDFISFLNNSLMPTSVSVNVMMLTNSSEALDLSGQANLTNVYLAGSPGRVVTYDGALTPAAGTYRFNGGSAVFGSSLIVGSHLTGTNNLTIGPIGVVVLTNNNDYTGWTYITGGGTLQLGTNTASGTLGNSDDNPLSVVTNNGTLVIARSDTYSLTNVIRGTGALVKNGDNLLIVTTNNYYTGATTINGGTLRAGATNAFGFGAVNVNNGATPNFAGNFYNAPGTLDMNGLGLVIGGLSGQFGGVVTDNSSLGGYNALSVNQAGTFNYFGLVKDGPVTGLSLAKYGAGVMSLGGTNAYTGGTFVSAGILRASYGVGLPYAGNLTLATGGVFETGGYFTNALGAGSGQVQILAGGNAGFSANGIYGFEAFGTATVVNLGGVGAPVVWGSQFFNPGQFVLNSGTTNNVLVFENALDLNGATRYVNVGGSTSVISGTIFNSSSVTNAMLQKEGSGWLFVASPMNLTGSVYANGGTLVLATNNLITGVSQVGNGATMYIYSDASLGTATNFMLGNTNNIATTLRTTNNIALTKAITMAGDASIYVDYNSVLLLTNAVVGARRLYATGPGTLILSNGIDSIASLDVRGTVLATTNSLILSTNGFFGNSTAGALGPYGSAMDSNFLRSVSTGAVRAATSFLGALVLGQDSGNELNFNIYQGLTNAAPEIGGNTNLIIGPVGSIGTVFLTNNNTFVGTAVVVGSTLRAADGIGLPATAALTLSGGVFEIFSQTAGSIFNRTLGSGLGQVQVLGTNGLGGSGFSTTNGPATILFGGVASNIVWGSPYFNPSVLILNTNTADSTLTLANGLNLNNATRTIMVGGNTGRIDGTIYTSAGNVGLIKVGGGTLLLDDENHHWGNTINGGTVQLGSALGLGSVGSGADAAATLTVNNGGVLDLNGFNVLAQSLAGSVGAVITDNSTNPGVSRLTVSLVNQNVNNTLTYAGSIQDGPVRQVGLTFGQWARNTEVLTLPYSNSYSGGTVVFGGDLLIGSTNSLGSGSVRLTAGGALGPAYAMLDQSFLNWVASRSDNTPVRGAFGMLNLGQNLNANNLDFSSRLLTNAFLGVMSGNTVLYTGALTPAADAWRLGGGGGSLFFTQVLDGARNLEIGPKGAATGAGGG
ncbi:MAG: autotransporter-associated beta strand repeat-containing protein, partial [Verrucomicrobia bacterium]|nr:autotransporter-associated beta strand repeat-containing protein [Verrucomicrobiota bacterium]